MQKRRFPEWLSVNEAQYSIQRLNMISVSFQDSNESKLNDKLFQPDCYIGPGMGFHRSECVHPMDVPPLHLSFPGTL